MNVQKVTKEEYEALAGFRYALRTFLHFSEEAAQSAGLTPQQHQTLLAVMGFPGREEITIGELAGRLQIAHHSAVGLVDRLMAQKLLSRRKNPDDGRQVLLAVTPDGRRILESLSAVHRDELRRLGPELSALLQRLQPSEMVPE